MIILILTVLLQPQGQELLGPPQPSVYHWKDSAGRLYVTTTVPPPNATILEVLTNKNAEIITADESDVISMNPAAHRLQMESAMEEKTIKYWHSKDKSFLVARQTGNNAESIKTLDALFKDVLWGDGLWAIALLPLVVMTIVLLIAWWVCSALSKSAKVSAWAGFVFVGLLLSHVSTINALYRPQAKRLDFMLSMLPQYLGGYIQLKPDNQKAIRSHVAALPKTVTNLSPAWNFPMEIYHIRKTLRKVVLDP